MRNLVISGNTMTAGGRIWRDRLNGLLWIGVEVGLEWPWRALSHESGTQSTSNRKKSAKGVIYASDDAA